MRQPSLVIDGHLDLAANALQLRRDLTLPAVEVRAQDSAEVCKEFGTCTVTLPELRKGRIGIVFATVMTRVDPSGGFAGTGMRTQAQCYGIGRGHAAYYEALERRGEVRILRTARDLRETVDRWRAAESPQASHEGQLHGGERIGIVLAMEGADPILDPGHVAVWGDIGLRVVGLSHYGKGIYAHGTGSQGGLLPPARELLAALAAERMIVDVTHLADEGLAQALELYEGPLIASHHNCRALVPGERQLPDELVRALIARDAVIGASLDLWMLDPEWKHGNKPTERRLGLEAVADHIQHVCELAGSSLHAAIGSDLDGGFGLECSPAGLDTIADLPRLAAILESRGFGTSDVENVLWRNWVRVLERALR